MHVVTVGAYIEVDDRYLFVFGPNPTRDKLSVLRVGGHLEPGESHWECAAREAMEETGLVISPVDAPETLTAGRPFAGFRPFIWNGPGPRPLLVLPRSADPDAPCNVMYLARASGAPRPCHEVDGLLLLRPDEACALCARPTTLAEFQAAGGQAIMRRPYSPDLILEPALQLRLLSELLVCR